MVHQLENFSLYADVSDVDDYAKRQGKEWWTILEDDQKKDFLERSSNMIHEAHKQGHLWRHADLQFVCILQAIHVAKFGISADVGEHANNAGGWSDGVVTSSGGRQTWDKWAESMLSEVIDKAGIITGARWSRG